MQRSTTLAAYPNLFELTPITGTVYKPSMTLRPHPRMAPMPLAEVQQHQKREGLAALERSGSSKKTRARFFKRTASESPEGREKKGLLRGRTSKAKGMFFLQRSGNGSIQEPLVGPPHAPSLTTGFHCATHACTTCHSLPPLPPPEQQPALKITTTPQVQPDEPLLSFTASSGFTSWSGDSDSDSDSISPSLPTIHLSPTASDVQSLSDSQLDLDVFPDFDGVHGLSEEEEIQGRDSSGNGTRDLVSEEDVLAAGKDKLPFNLDLVGGRGDGEGGDGGEGSEDGGEEEEEARE